MTQEEREALGRRIRQFRGFALLTQEELAKAAGTTRKTVTLVENGYKQPNIDMLKGFCRTLGVDPNVLLGWNERPEAELAQVES